MNIQKNTLSNWLLILVVTLLLSILGSTNFFGYSRDYTDYYNYYNSTINPIGIDTSRFTIGFKLLKSAFSIANIEFAVFIFVLSFISLLMKFHVISKCNNKLFFWLTAYFFIILPLHEFTQIRISIAIGFLYLSFYFFGSKNFFLSGILLLTGTMMHLGILFFLPVLTIFLGISKKTKLPLLPFLLILITSCYFFFDTAISNNIDYFYNYYFSASQDSSNIFSVRFLSFAIISLCGLFYLKNFNHKEKIWFIFSIFGIFYYLIFNNFAILSYRLFEISLLSFFMWVEYLPPNLRLLSKILITLNCVLSINNFFLSNFLSEYPYEIFSY